MSEVNREQAERALSLARAAERAGDLAKARRLAAKAARLCPALAPEAARVGAGAAGAPGSSAPGPSSAVSPGTLANRGETLSSPPGGRECPRLHVHLPPTPPTPPSNPHSPG